IYEDENIFIVYKPIKIKSEGLFSMEYFINLNVNNHYKLVHRLDTNTDGLLIFSKKYDIYEMLKEVFIKKEIKKFYQAIIYYEPKLNLKTPVTFVDYLTKFDNQSKVSISNKMSRNSQEIKTIINKITPLFSNVYLFDIEIPTGKTHQIRAQLSYHNFKIVGDEKYGNILINKKFNWTTQILTFHSLQFNISNNPKLEYLNDLEITIDNMDIRSSIGSFLSSQKNIQHKLDS
ncbi:MAG: RNA pseudouridine synthase, partial [Clostridia bacterium]|nr:RNA pseudouridine synthase [Clostridia bacterium]